MAEKGGLIFSFIPLPPSLPPCLQDRGAKGGVDSLGRRSLPPSLSPPVPCSLYITKPPVHFDYLHQCEQEKDHTLGRPVCELEAGKEARMCAIDPDISPLPNRAVLVVLLYSKQYR